MAEKAWMLGRWWVTINVKSDECPYLGGGECSILDDRDGFRAKCDKEQCPIREEVK